MQCQFDDLEVETYQGEPPPFIWKAIEHLYHSGFCSESHLKAYGTINQETQLWVSRQAGVIDAVLLFQIKNRRAIVLNELVALSSLHINLFSIFIFKQYRAVKIIQFKAIFQIDGKIIFPFQDFVFSEDFILDLPLSADIWLKSLSKKMRAILRNQSSQSQQSAPGLEFRCIHHAAITAQLVQQVLMLSRLRMQVKGKKFGISAIEEQCLIAVMRERGVMYVCEVDGKIIAGLLCTFCEKDLFFHVIAHDLAFDDLRAGILCCYQSILSAIENKYERIHFLWGCYQYKLQFGAQEKKLIKLSVFSKSFYQFIFPGSFLQKLLQKLKQKTKQLHNAKRLTLLRRKFFGAVKYTAKSLAKNTA